MATTRNGFTVQPEGSKNLAKLDVDGVPFVMWKPTIKLVRHITTFLNAVEPVKEAGWDGGYAHRPVRGSNTTPSEHSAGTAFDWNASQHPRGGSRYGGWSTEQVRVIRWYLGTNPGKQWKWGADFTTTVDPMHFELRSKALWDETDDWWKH